MGKYRPRCAALVVYEITRLVFTLMIFTVLVPEGAQPFPWLSLVTPGALFFLLALVMLPGRGRRRLYGPLYMAGKALCLFTACLWFFFLRGYTAGDMALGSRLFFMTPVFVLGDALSILLVSTMIKNGRRR